MSDAAGFGARLWRRVVRIHRWQPANERQVWLYALCYGVFTGAVFGVVRYLHGAGSQWWLAEALPFGVAGVVTLGFIERHRLNRRQDGRDQA